MDVKRFLDGSGTLVWTMTTNGYKYYTLNLVHSLRAMGNLPWKLCIVCVDRESQAFLQGQGISTVLFSERIPIGQMDPSQWHSDSFHRITRLKLSIMDEFINNPNIKNIVYLDGDIIVKRDFVPWIYNNLSLGVWYFQCDEDSEVACSSLKDCPNFCTGCILYRKSGTEESNPFHVESSIWNTCKGNHDQEYVQRRVRDLGLPFETIDRWLFPNGKMIKNATEPFLRHYNYRIGNNKKRGMMLRGDWLIPY